MCHGGRKPSREYESQALTLSKEKKKNAKESLEDTLRHKRKITHAVEKNRLAFTECFIRAIIKRVQSKMNNSREIQASLNDN